MKYLIVIMLLMSPASMLMGQDKKQKDSKDDLTTHREEWYEGSLMTTDGAELKGLLWFNDNNGVLSFRSGEASRVFTARSVAGFEMFDENQQRQRVFYSLEYEDPDQPGGKRSYFFELLNDFGKFAVLTKTNPLESDIRGTASSYTPYTGFTSNTTYTEISQTETIYFMKATGEIEPYLKVIKKEFIGRTFWDQKRERNKLVDQDAFARYITESVYRKLEEFAKENDLKFRHKDDFLKILQHYAENYAKK